MSVKVTKVGGRYAPKWSIEAGVPRVQVNGRKAWRRAAKKLRRKLREGAKDQIPLVEHLPEKLAKCIAKRMRRHGTIVAADHDATKRTTLFYMSFEAGIAGWEAEIEYRPKRWSDRFKIKIGTYWALALVGMSQSMRKRLRRLFKSTGIAGYHDPQVRLWRVGERIKPCPGCKACDRYFDGMVQSPEQFCDGFGVKPSKRGKPHACSSGDCGKPSIGRTDEGGGDGRPGYLCFHHTAQAARLMGYDWLSDDHARAYDAHWWWREHNDIRKQQIADQVLAAVPIEHGEQQ